MDTPSGKPTSFHHCQMNHFALPWCIPLMDNWCSSLTSCSTNSSLNFQNVSGILYAPVYFHLWLPEQLPGPWYLFGYLTMLLSVQLDNYPNLNHTLERRGFFLLSMITLTTPQTMKMTAVGIPKGVIYQEGWSCSWARLARSWHLLEWIHDENPFLYC